MKFCIILFILHVGCRFCVAEDVQFEKLTSYQTLTGAGQSLIAVPSVEIKIPKLATEEIYSVDVSDKIHVLFSPIKATARGHLRSIDIAFPDMIKEPLTKLLSSGRFFSLIGSTYAHPYITDTGTIRLPLNEGEKIFTSPPDTHIRAVTPQPSNGLIAAVLIGSGVDNKSIAGIDVAHNTIVWQFLPKGLHVDQRLSWINPDLLLSTLYGRIDSECTVINVKTHSIVAQDSMDAGGRYIVHDNSVFSFNAKDGLLNKVFPKE